MKIIRIWVAILALLATSAARAAEPPSPYNLQIPSFAKAPKIDGMIETEIWDAAVRMESFTQFEPQEGAGPSERTIGYVGYDKDNLYLAFRCFDSDPEAVRACLTQRDQSRGDDGVRVFIDTFNDKKRAFVFEINPCGIQNDGVYTETRRMGGRGGMGGGGGFEMYDKNWDTFFVADARIDDQGYTVEIAIPFKSLRFPNTPIQTWGLQIQRTIRRKNEEIFWRPRTRSVNGFLVQAGAIEFRGDIEKGKNIEIMPVATGSKINQGKIDPQAGINLKYGITSDLTADLTYNPDFSQIEADIPQVDVNQRYPLYYPEKRPFFLEGKDFFDTPFELVYTRNIIDPRWGIKLTGKAGKTTLGFLSALDENPPFISFPNAPGGVFNDGRNKSWMNVVRLRHDLFSESYLGAIFTDKEMGRTASGIFDNYSRVAGVDGTFKFADYYRFSFQFVGSQNKVGTETTGFVPAASATLAHQSRHLEASLEWTYLPPDFEAGAGFFRRKDINSFSARAGYAILPQTNFLVSATPSVEYRRIYDFSNILTDEELNFTLRLSGWRHSSIFLNLGTGLERYNGVDFRGTDAWLSFNSEPWAWLGLNLMASIGDGIYYSDAPYQGWKSNIGVRLSLRPLTNLRLAYNIQNSSFFKSRGGENVYRINLISQRITYQISKPLSVRWVTDWDDYYRKLYISLLLGYELRPGTVFYLGLDDSQERDGNGIFRGLGRYYFVKFSYWWRM